MKQPIVGYHRDEEGHWVNKPFATRLIEGGPERVTLLGDRLKHHNRDGLVEEPVTADRWDDELARWFGMRRAPAT